mmetsp:Transcript_29094/g.47017  ORF Transcript_29094/g.47017 Transcript_29094/m.47017 type:complete len:134 (+) Transcript_29094:738-1139(+)
MDMIAFKPDRIGHANCLNDEVLHALMNAQVPLEVCPTSNVMTESVSSYENHHFRDFWLAKYPLAICTDDKGVFKTSLSREYAIMATVHNLNKGDLKLLSVNPLEFIFASDSTKELLREDFQTFFSGKQWKDVY